MALGRKKNARSSGVKTGPWNWRRVEYITLTALRHPCHCANAQARLAGNSGQGMAILPQPENLTTIKDPLWLMAYRNMDHPCLSLGTESLQYFEQAAAAQRHEEPKQEYHSNGPHQHVLVREDLPPVSHCLSLVQSLAPEPTERKRVFTRVKAK